MFDLLSHFAHFRNDLTMLAPRPEPFPGPPSCSLTDPSQELDKNGLEYFCYQKQLFTGVTPEPPAKGSLAVTVWSKGTPIDTYVQGKGARANVYEKCSIGYTPEHRGFQLEPETCHYVEPYEVPYNTVPFGMTW